MVLFMCKERGTVTVAAVTAYYRVFPFETIVLLMFVQRER